MVVVAGVGVVGGCRAVVPLGSSTSPLRLSVHLTLLLCLSVCHDDVAGVDRADCLAGVVGVVPLGLNASASTDTLLRWTMPRKRSNGR